MPTTIDQPRVEFEIRTPICPTCGCSLARLGVRREDAAHGHHEGNEYLFCCDGCRDTFMTEPERYLAQIRDVVVCPACLAEKPRAVMVAVEHGETTVHFCGCPGCFNAFRRDPEGVLARLGGVEAASRYVIPNISRLSCAAQASCPRSARHRPPSAEPSQNVFEITTLPS